MKSTRRNRSEDLAAGGPNPAGKSCLESETSWLPRSRKAFVKDQKAQPMKARSLAAVGISNPKTSTIRTYVGGTASSTSDVVILSGQDFTGQPLAVVELPVRGTVWFPRRLGPRSAVNHHTDRPRSPILVKTATLVIVGRLADIPGRKPQPRRWGRRARFPAAP